MNFARLAMPDRDHMAQSALPFLWKNLLIVVAIGKASVGGAGAALALAGALNIAAAATAQHWLHDVEQSYLDYFALGGGLTGATLGVISLFSARL